MKYKKLGILFLTFFLTSCSDSNPNVYKGYSVIKNDTDSWLTFKENNIKFNTFNEVEEKAKEFYKYYNFYTFNSDKYIISSPSSENDYRISYNLDKNNNIYYPTIYESFRIKEKEDSTKEYFRIKCVLYGYLYDDKITHYNVSYLKDDTDNYYNKIKVSISGKYSTFGIFLFEYLDDSNFSEVSTLLTYIKSGLINHSMIK